LKTPFKAQGVFLFQEELFMAILTIGGRQFEAKANFRFERLADKKYRDKDAKNEMSGLEQIYQDLMAYKISALVAFWDCATSHYVKEQPSTEMIEDALSKVIEEDEDGSAVENLFKEAFQTVDNSGFFRLQLKEFWKNLDLIDKFTDDEKERQQGKVAKEMFIAKRQELNPSITTTSLQTVEDSSECSTQD
jgi:Phage tail assembly chaperone protein, TAC